MNHVRKPWRRGFRTTSSGHTFRAKDPTPETLCGAEVTDRDLTVRDAKAKDAGDWIECQECLKLARGAA